MYRWASTKKRILANTAWAELTASAAGSFAIEWMQQPASALVSSDAKIVIQAYATKEGMIDSKTSVESATEVLVSSVLQLERAAEYTVEQDSDLNIHIQPLGLDEDGQRAQYRWCRIDGSDFTEWQSLTPATAAGLLSEIVDPERDPRKASLVSSQMSVGLQIRVEVDGKIASDHKRDATVQKITAPIVPQPIVTQSDDGLIRIDCELETAKCFYQWRQNESAPPSDGWRAFVSSTGLQDEFEASFDAPGATLFAKSVHNGMFDSDFETGPVKLVLGNVCSPVIGIDPKYGELEIGCATPGATIYRRWSRPVHTTDFDGKAEYAPDPSDGLDWAPMGSVESVNAERISAEVTDMTAERNAVMIQAFARKPGHISSPNSLDKAPFMRVEIMQVTKPIAGYSESAKITLESSTPGCTIVYRFCQTADTKPFNDSMDRKWKEMPNFCTPHFDTFLRSQFIGRRHGNDEVIIEAYAKRRGMRDSERSITAQLPAEFLAKEDPGDYSAQLREREPFVANRLETMRKTKRLANA